MDGGHPHPYSEADARDFLELARQGRKTATRHDFAITLVNDPGALLGVITLAIKSDAVGMELGYWLAEPFWGQGLMGEAAEAVVDYSFGPLGFRKITASYQLGNEASRRILERLGFADVQRETGFSRAQGKDIQLLRLALNIDLYVKIKERDR
jgi:RimJ/RimL family protein N-acetyltransferase